MKRLKPFTATTSLLSLLVSAASAQVAPPKAAVREVAESYFGQRS